MKYVNIDLYDLKITEDNINTNRPNKLGKNQKKFLSKW